MADDWHEFEHVDGLARLFRPDSPVPGVRRVTLDAGEGAVVSALRWGTGAAEVIFLHGAGLHAHSWDATAVALGRSALALDLPGHGDSTWRAADDYSPGRLAECIHRAIAPLIDTPVVLVGQSLGGLVVIRLAELLSPFVSAVVLVDVTPSHQADFSVSAQTNDFMSGPESYDSRDDIIDRALRFGIGSSRADLSRGVRLNTRVREDGRVIFKHHFAVLPADIHLLHDATVLWPVLKRLRLPTALIRGDTGIVTERQLAEFSTWLPDAPVMTLTAGHNVQRDAPGQLAKTIVDFEIGQLNACR